VKALPMEETGEIVPNPKYELDPMPARTKSNGAG